MEVGSEANRQAWGIIIESGVAEGFAAKIREA